MRLRDESARFVHGVTIVFDGRDVDIRVCEQKIEIDAVGEHLFAGAVVVLKAEQNVEILILCPVLYAQVGVPVGADLVFPRQGFINGGAALQKVICKAHAGVAAVIIDLGNDLRRVVSAAAAQAVVHVHLVFIQHKDAFFHLFFRL